MHVAQIMKVNSYPAIFENILLVAETLVMLCYVLCSMWKKTFSVFDIPNIGEIPSIDLNGSNDTQTIKFRLYWTSEDSHKSLGSFFM